MRWLLRLVAAVLLAGALRQAPAATFNLQVLATDATSVRLHWPPQPGAAEYAVSRDGADAGRTAGALGYFSDFDLRPARTYRYAVTALDGAGGVLATSAPAAATTADATTVRTHYTVLAIAFNPEHAGLVKETVYLRHRIQFLQLASLGSANIDIYHGAVVDADVAPAVEPGSTFVDYAALVLRRDLPGLDGNSIVDLVERGDIDHVWVVKSPINFLENALIGNRGIQGNGLVGPYTWLPAAVKSSRSFFVNAYLPDARSWDAYTHMAEGVMTSISEGYPALWPRDREYHVYTHDRSSYATVPAALNEWERFRITDGWNGAGDEQYASPGAANIGSSHFPPTTPRVCADYCYYDVPTWQRYVDSVADDWLHYPDLIERTRRINGYEFGAFNDYALGDASYAPAFGGAPERHPSFRFGTASYHQWWFTHVPHNPGVTEGRLDTWWPYLFDFNRFDGAPIDYPVGGFAPVTVASNPVDGEYGTNDPVAEHWGYWHSDNGFSPGAKAATLASLEKAGAVTFAATAADTIFANGFEPDRLIAVSVENAQNWEELGHGRNDVFYPASRDAHWHVADLAVVQLAIKLGENPGLVVDTNPIVRLCRNGNTRIEFVPRQNGLYANLFQNPALRDAEGWYRFVIPAAGDATWEKNVIGYIDPDLSPAQQETARLQIEHDVLADLNYVAISIRTTTSQSGDPDDVVSYYLDGLRLLPELRQAAAKRKSETTPIDQPR